MNWDHLQVLMSIPQMQLFPFKSFGTFSFYDKLWDGATMRKILGALLCVMTEP